MIRVYLPIYRDGQPLLIKTRIITLCDPVSLQFAAVNWFIKRETSLYLVKSSSWFLHIAAMDP